MIPELMNQEFWLEMSDDQQNENYKLVRPQIKQLDDILVATFFGDTKDQTDRVNRY